MLLVLILLSDFKVSLQFHDLHDPLISVLGDVQELGVVRPASEDRLLPINNLTAAETSATVRLWAHLSWWVIKKISVPSPVHRSGRPFHRDFKRTCAG